MGFSNRYDAAQHEQDCQATWATHQTFAFDPNDPRPIFAVDTPPPTVSGDIHIGHVYSYVQAEAMIRFWRMQGRNVYYPFGFDDNGLPTERYVERSRKIRARDLPRAEFIATCLEVSRDVEDRFEIFWKSLGMSVDWRLRYSTIDPHARKISQWSFIDLFQKGRIYRAQAPNPWCVECQTAIAQAELDDAERQTTFYTLSFEVVKPRSSAEDAITPQSTIYLPIATTRPELLPACVAIFVHPDDTRYQDLIGQQAIIPLIGRQIPILADPGANPQKGTGAVMCCTFGDSADVGWWKAYHLPLIPLITRIGTLGDSAGTYAGLKLAEARARILADLDAAGLLLDARPTSQSVRIHERCKTPIEILETNQWFIRVLDLKQELLAAGRQIAWHPEYMRTRYEHWVENLSWDWCISRQRFYGVPFPAWHCTQCGAILLADPAQLPVDPTVDLPIQGCMCGGALRPDEDVMDTWATSSVSPLIATHFPEAQGLQMLPMQLRPQAHDIIRTWAFDTIVKHHLHYGQIPWETLMISGHALAPDGTSIHKSLGNSPIDPHVLITRHGADAVRYWACGGGLGADQPVHESEMKQGVRLAAKLWSAARFLAGFAEKAVPSTGTHSALLPTDRALRSWTHRTIARATTQYTNYEYAAARETIERFFWDTLCDNALEWSKSRLYDQQGAPHTAALESLQIALLATLKLLAPIMPHVTEAIYQQLFADSGATFQSIHTAGWPSVDQAMIDPTAERTTEALIAIGAAVRRFKTTNRLGLGTQIARIVIATEDAELRELLSAAEPDLRSLTRTEHITWTTDFSEAETIAVGLAIRIDR
ncbi:MAG: valine--tRNA ligase [Roseiflexaceae bacterium]|nr:valine--tRNA ligase [Roseiflexaceae bacterium]